MPRVISAFAICILFAVSPRLEAQVLDRPARAFRGLFGGPTVADPNATRTELTLRANALGGYGDDLLTLGIAPLDPVETGSVSTWTADAALSFFWGRAARSLSASGFVNTTSYQPGPIGGGDVRGDVSGRIGRKQRFGVSAQAEYMPYLPFGAFESVGGDLDASVSPDANPEYGFVQSHAWRRNAAASLGREWSIRDTTTLVYTYDDRVQQDRTSEADEGYDTRTQLASIGHERSFGRSVQVTGSYSFGEDNAYGLGTSGAPMQHHDLEFGIAYLRAISRTRSVGFTAAAGASRLEVSTFDALRSFVSWNPSFRGGVSMQLGRSWAFQGDYHRSVSRLSGISRLPFATDAALLHVGGLLGRRLELALSAGLSRGDGEGPGSALSRYEAYSGTAQLRWAVARWWAATVNYNYYDQDVFGVPDAPASLPSRFNRSAVRVGISMWLPLYGGAPGS